MPQGSLAGFRSSPSQRHTQARSHRSRHRGAQPNSPQVKGASLKTQPSPPPQDMGIGARPTEGVWPIDGGPSVPSTGMPMLDRLSIDAHDATRSPPPMPRREGGSE
eukprot:6874069-Prymnesium_polylepis.2